MKQTRIDHLLEQTIDYVGNFVYEDNVLKYILTGEGRVSWFICFQTVLLFSMLKIFFL